MLHLCRKLGSLWLGRPETRFNFVSKTLICEFECSTLQNPRLLSSLQNPRLLSSLQVFENKEHHRPISISVLVRSIVSIVQKTDTWDSLLTRLCVVSSSTITPRIAVQVIKRIRKPVVAFQFFQWLQCREGFNHDSLSYSAILKVLTRDSHPLRASVAEGLLRKKIGIGLDASPSDFECVLQQWVRVGKTDKALGLLDEMRSRGFVPSCLSCNVLLQGLLKSKQMNLGLALFREMQDGWINGLDTESFNYVMKVACVGGRMEEAMDFYYAMKETDCVPNLDSFNILIKGFSEKGDADMICSLFKQMLDLKIKPDSYTMNLLIKELCKQGRPERGNDLFNHMRMVGWIDKKFVYTQLVDSLCNYGWWLKALKVFVKMVRRGHHPKFGLYNNLVRRLCMGGRFRQAFRLKDLIAKKGFLSDVDNYSALMEGVCLAGRMDMADKLLYELKHKRLDLSLRIWNALLHGHCMAKNVTKAIEIMENIKDKGMVPDLGPCHNLINHLMVEEKDEAIQLKSCIEVFQNINYDADITSMNEPKQLDGVGVLR